MARMKKAYGVRGTLSLPSEQEINKGMDIAITWKVFTSSEKFLYGPKPIRIISNGEHVATLVDAAIKIYPCEVCGENLIEPINFKNENGVWERILLCERCKSKYIYGREDV